MSGSEYFRTKLLALMKTYEKTFPDTKYAGSFSMATHITPSEERMKKMFLVLPHWGRNNDVPALVCTVHQHRGSKTLLHMHIINHNILGTTSALSLRVSLIDRKVNHDVMDKIIIALKSQLWSVGTANPDHYDE